MSSTNRPLPVPEGAVEALQATDALRLNPTATAATWAPGAACAVVAGPFAGFSAAVLSVTDETAHITVLMFGALRDVTVPTAHLAPPVS
jgi:transcription antitermination factor NusG